MRKRIVLCADDYGQAPEISKAICTLAGSGRLSATSCMVNMRNWEEQADWLSPHQSQLDIGLHLNLTQGQALSAAFRQHYGEWLIPLHSLLLRALMHQIDRSIILAECEAQIERFYAAMGFMPHFIDGHQHVHQFPLIRDAVIEAYEKHLRPQKAYMRLVQGKLYLAETIKHFKKFIIYTIGAQAFKQQLDKLHIPYNQTFSGIYSFKQYAKYRIFFRQFLHEITDGGLIMCHPGLNMLVRPDPIAAARVAEFSYFFSADFLHDCDSQKVKIARFIEIL